MGSILAPLLWLALTAGVVGSQFDVSWDGQAEEYWDVGTRYGVGIDTALFDGVSLRLNWSVIDYYDAEVFGIGSVTESGNSGHNVKIEPSMSVAHLGLLYTF